MALVSVVQTIGQVALSSMAGYGLARIPFRHANVVLAAIVASTRAG